MKLSEILNSEEKKIISWYPSSGLDFRDLLALGQKKFIYDKNVFANELLEFEAIPDLFIHTDNAYDFDNWPLVDKGVIHQDEETVYTISSTEDIVSEDDCVVGKFLKVKLESVLLEEETSQDLLFLFYDNIDFFKRQVLKNNLSVDFLVNIRDGASENGGANYSLKMLEFYLGKMNTKYLISDNFGRSPKDITQFKEDTLMMEAITSAQNKPVVLQGLKEWSWSEFGAFKGDAFLMMVHHLFNPLNDA